MQMIHTTGVSMLHDNLSYGISKVNVIWNNKSSNKPRYCGELSIQSILDENQSPGIL